MRAKLHMYAMKFKPAIKKYREAWRADPERYEALNRRLRECRIGVSMLLHLIWAILMKALMQTKEMTTINCIMP
jgi:hypothetical protein